MPIDVTEPRSPGWWLLRLARKREAEHKGLQDLWDRYEGRGPLPEMAAKMPSAAKTFFNKSRLNLAELVVGLKLERMRVRAIRTSVSQVRSDDAAWRMFASNDGHIFWEDALEKALVMGKVCLMVGLREGTDTSGPLSAEDVVITPEDPRQTVTIQDPLRKSEVRAAAKFYHDPDYDTDHAYLYMEGRVWHATRPMKAKSGASRFSPALFDWDPDYDGVNGRELKAGWTGNPVRRMRNKGGVGEFERHLDPLDRIDHMILQRMVIATMQAFKQRAIKGDLPRVYPEGHPQAGQEIDYDEMFQSDPGALWMIPGAAELWESGQVDLTGILSAVKDDIRNLAAVTRSSLPSMAPDGANQTAEGAELAREGQTFATENRTDRFGLDLAWAIQTGFDLIGDETRGAGTVFVDWMPITRHPLTSMAQAGQLAKATGMSRRFILEKVWQMDPDDVDREISAAATDLLFSSPVDQADAGVPSAAATTSQDNSVENLKVQADALGALIRAGVEPSSAMRATGLTGLTFTGRIPVFAP